MTVLGRPKSDRLQTTREEEILLTQQEEREDDEEFSYDLLDGDWSEFEDLDSPFAVRANPSLDDLAWFV